MIHIYFCCTQTLKTKCSFFVSRNIPGVNIYIEEYSKDSLNFLFAAVSVCPFCWDTVLLIWIWLFDMYVIAEVDTLTELLAAALIKKSNNSTFKKQEERVVNLRASARTVPVYSSHLYYFSRIK